MDLTPMHKRVIALDVHQAKITASAVVEHDDGRVEVTKRDFGAFRRDRRALAECGAEKNRLHKVLVDAGICFKVLVADIHGASARAMVKALIVS